MCEPQVEAGVHRPRDHGAGAGPAWSRPRRSLVNWCQSTLEYGIYLHVHDSFSTSHRGLLMIAPIALFHYIKDHSMENIKGDSRGPTMNRVQFSCRLGQDTSCAMYTEQED